MSTYDQSMIIDCQFFFGRVGVFFSLARKDSTRPSLLLPGFSSADQNLLY